MARSGALHHRTQLASSMGTTVIAFFFIAAYLTTVNASFAFAKHPSTKNRHRRTHLSPTIRSTSQIKLFKSKRTTGIFQIASLHINGEKREPRKWPLALIGLGTWTAAITGFLVTNYVSGPWPAGLVKVHRQTWAFIHAISSMLFGGTIIVSTLIEWLVARSQSPSVLKFWFLTVPSLDSAVVVPALTGSIVSGVMQAAQNYGNLASAPKYIIGGIHALATFGLWWALTDLTTQHSARQQVSEWCQRVEKKGATGDIPRVVYLRRWSNVVSCLFVATLYALMVLKPGALI